MEKPELASTRKVSRRRRKSVKKKAKPKTENVATTYAYPTTVVTTDEKPKQSFKDSLTVLWGQRPQLKKIRPSAAEVEQFKEDYKLWQMNMNKLLE